MCRFCDLPSLRSLNGAFSKDRGLRRAFRVVVVILERTEKRQVRIAAEGATVWAVVDRTEPGDEMIVEGIKLAPCFNDFVFRPNRRAACAGLRAPRHAL